MDVRFAYQNALLYIRQLSLLLRRAMHHKTKDATQSVRRWQVGWSWVGSLSVFAGSWKIFRHTMLACWRVSNA